ncbi:MAG: hypothetical protein GC202_09960 [Alphaproteobacteria bacterium]|nr:hypothetical protein [Alphaproteobacteria bacterium]
MTSEYRIVFFDDREIVSALIDHARTQGTRLPPGQVRRMSVARGSFDVRLFFQRRAEEETPLDFHSAALAQALIRHCKKKGIPLPVKSNKELRMVDDRIAFVVEVSRPSGDSLIPIEYV